APFQAAAAQSVELTLIVAAERVPDGIVHQRIYAPGGFVGERTDETMAHEHPPARLLHGFPLRGELLDRDDVLPAGDAVIGGDPILQAVADSLSAGARQRDEAGEDLG